MLQLAAMDGVLLGERCAACGWLGPREGCGWHGVIAALEEFVAELLAGGAFFGQDALRVEGPDPRRPSDRSGCVHVRVGHPTFLEDPSVLARIETIAAEWKFSIVAADQLGFWLAHAESPPSRPSRPEPLEQGLTAVPEEGSK